jgi:predicted signal transduction protein with EAL and GGDEF domain
MEFLLAVVGLAVLAALCAILGVLLSHNRRLRARLRYGIEHDPATGLLNRQGFDRAAHRALRGSATSAALRIDVDPNGVGSAVLGCVCSETLVRTAAERASSILGERSLLGRLSGSSFAVLLAECGAGGAREVAGTLLDRLAAPYPIGGRHVDVDAVLGYATVEANADTDSTTVFRRAELALRCARDAGCRIGTYRPGMEWAFLRGLRLAQEFRQAACAGELLVHYQPLADLPSGMVGRVETLVRWRHPDFGELDGDDFVPCIEASGLVDVLTSLVLEQALLAVRGWLDEGVRLSASVNLSVRDLADDRFPERVAAALRRHRVPPELLIFELTESGMISDDGALPVLRELHALGCGLALDDFGTGYSSLAYLRALPLDEVKIDKSFVLGMTSECSDRAVVRSIIELGHSLGLNVVAEGVENEDAVAALEQLGCDAVQGYLIAPPLPAARFATWFVERAAAPERSVWQASRGPRAEAGPCSA